MVNNDVHKVIAHIEVKGKQLIVKRDQNYKYWVFNDHRITQRRLTANEIVCYLMNALQMVK